MHSEEKVMFTVNLLVQFGIWEVVRIDPVKGEILRQVREETEEEDKEIDRLVAKRFGTP